MDRYGIVDSGFAPGDMMPLEPDENAFRRASHAPAGNLGARQRPQDMAAYDLLPFGDPPYGHPMFDEWVARLATARTATESEDTRASDQHG